MKNKERFFGLHFDFHANENTKDITIDPASIQKIIDIAKPDFIQCDCKGHDGISSYPTRIGYACPSIKDDILRIWREVTKKNGIPLYVHYSGVWDKKAVEEHPQWAVTNSDGSKSNIATSTVSEYADKLMIPQLKELAGEYGIDGAWIDGDCWGTMRDYSEKMKNEFCSLYNTDRLPTAKDDSLFKEFNEFCRQKFRNYVKHYVDAIHSEYPEFKITSNWAFTTYMPEKICADVDCLSGDVWGIDNLNKIRFESRFMANQGKPWDLMSWNLALMSKQNGDQTGMSDYITAKPSVQLMQEAAGVISQGGGFQIYYKQEKNGSVNPDNVLTAGDVSGFCHEREKFCFNSESKSEIAILYSGYAANRLNESLYAFWNGDLDWIKGMLQCMLDSGLSVDIVTEFQDISKYKVIVIPEWEELNNKEELLKFAKAGGRLIVTGNKCTQMFSDALGITVDGETENAQVILNENNLVTSFGCNTNICIAKAGTAEIIDCCKCTKDDETKSELIASSVNKYGDGLVAGVYFDFGRQYIYGKSIGACDFIKKTVDMILPEKSIEVSGTRYVETVFREKNGCKIVGLINIAGAHSDNAVFNFDEIPRSGAVRVCVKSKNKPKSVYLQPENRKLDYIYDNGYVVINLEYVKIFDLIVIEENTNG